MCKSFGSVSQPLSRCTDNHRTSLLKQPCAFTCSGEVEEQGDGGVMSLPHVCTEVVSDNWRGRGTSTEMETPLLFLASTFRTAQALASCVEKDIKCPSLSLMP